MRLLRDDTLAEAVTGVVSGIVRRLPFAEGAGALLVLNTRFTTAAPVGVGSCRTDRLGREGVLPGRCPYKTSSSESVRLAD